MDSFNSQNTRQSGRLPLLVVASVALIACQRQLPTQRSSSRALPVVAKSRHLFVTPSSRLDSKVVLAAFYSDQKSLKRNKASSSIVQHRPASSSIVQQRGHREIRVTDRLAAADCATPMRLDYGFSFLLALAPGFGFDYEADGVNDRAWERVL
ncbi:hypothetical protein CORC01_03499 [Colletotrichum orchidophilum]|uniref:Uncharacterized protein n=1 Tax=Colletotrichum orchidophilum TaxID=1209926 RepID=A0A1G4BID8_9PEZI|nr:uncharacterized protein CORC01_03499 [Colletotrichum orchidophilum]OHF01184.1 hypothetical protein CORC01_03499 [Colletotrichum orchidophilum]